MTKIKIENGKIIKEFKNKDESKKIAGLYNSFPRHVKAIQNSNTIIYDYVEGEILEKILYENLDKSLSCIKKIAYLLKRVHFEKVKKVKDYDLVCAKRAHCPKKNIFIPSVGYFGKIHGDLNTGNILITPEGNLILIDRISKEGDILFDFPFIISILCKFYETKNEEYKEMIFSFFDIYTKDILDKEGFFVSFRNNFINYGYFLVEEGKRDNSFFKEWKLSKKISDDLIKYASFYDYLKEL